MLTVDEMEKENQASKRVLAELEKHMKAEKAMRAIAEVGEDSCVGEDGGYAQPKQIPVTLTARYDYGREQYDDDYAAEVEVGLNEADANIVITVTGRDNKAGLSLFDGTEMLVVNDVSLVQLAKLNRALTQVLRQMQDLGFGHYGAYGGNPMGPVGMTGMPGPGRKSSPSSDIFGRNSNLVGKRVKM